MISIKDVLTNDHVSIPFQSLGKYADVRQIYNEKNIMDHIKKTDLSKKKN